MGKATDAKKGAAKAGADTKGPTTDTAKDAPKPDANKTAAEPKPEKVIATVKAGAMSAEVGPKVLAGLSESYVKEAQANKLIQEVEGKRFDLLAQLTQGIIKAAKADDTINLSATFGDDKKAMALLNDQLGLALGFREVTTVGEGDKAVKKIGYAKAVLKYFPSPKDDKAAPETMKKATLRTNFLHMLKKCAQAASAAVESGMTVKKDDATGTLMISGPEVVKKFGQDSVLLNDKLTVRDDKGETKLKEKPSFTALARMGAEAHGKTLQTRKDSRVNTGAVDPDTAMLSICNSLIAGIGKLKKPIAAKVQEALKSVQSAVDKALKG